MMRLQLPSSVLPEAPWATVHANLRIIPVWRFLHYWAHEQLNGRAGIEMPPDWAAQRARQNCGRRAAASVRQVTASLASTTFCRRGWGRTCTTPKPCSYLRLSLLDTQLTAILFLLPALWLSGALLSGVGGMSKLYCIQPSHEHCSLCLTTSATSCTRWSLALQRQSAPRTWPSLRRSCAGRTCRRLRST